jgi:hypothetical protein
MRIFVNITKRWSLPERRQLQLAEIMYNKTPEEAEILLESYATQNVIWH